MNKLLLIDNYETERFIFEDNFFLANCIASAKNSLTLSYIQTEQLLPSKYITEITRLFALRPTLHINMLPTDIQDIYDKNTLKIFLAQTFAQNNISQPAINWLDNEFGGTLSLLRTTTNTDIDNDQFIPTFSVTQLETYAACPFRYLAAYIWRLRPWQKEQLDADNRLLGNLIHDVLDTFAKAYLNTPLTDYDTLKSHLFAILQNKTQEYLQLGKVYQPITWHLQTEIIQRKLLAWLKAHSAYCKTDPSTTFYAGEYTFLEYTIAQSEIIGDIKLSGKIDRIDKGTTGIRLIDYKLGNLPAMQDINKGLSLQMLLYTHVLKQKFADHQQLLPQYYSFKANEYKDAFSLKKAELSELLHNAQEYTKSYAVAIKKGVFAAKPAKTATCRYCNYSTICRFVTNDTVSEEDD